MKRCLGPCKEVKEYTEFSKNRASRDGLQHFCKACCREAYNTKSPQQRRARNTTARMKLYEFARNYGSARGGCNMCGNCEPDDMLFFGLDGGYGPTVAVAVNSKLSRDAIRAAVDGSFICCKRCAI